MEEYFAWCRKGESRLQHVKVGDNKVQIDVTHSPARTVTVVVGHML